jgi:hypothetical protein
MASAKQIAWRKKFAKLYGKKKTGSKSTKSNPKVQKAIKDLKWKGLTSKPKKLSKAFIEKYKPKSEWESIKKMTQDQKTAEIEKDVRQHMKWKDAKRKYGYGTVDLLQFYFAVSPRMAKTLGLPKTPPKYGQSPAY